MKISRLPLKKIKKSMDVSNAGLFKIIATDFLKEIKGDEIERYKGYIEFYMNSPEIFSGNEGLVIDKLKSALASDKVDRQIFAIVLLERIDKIPDDKKSKVKELIKDIDKPSLPDEVKEKIKKIENKL